MRRAIMMLSLVLAITAAGNARAGCMEVPTYQALARATNPIRVVQGNGPLVNMACLAWQEAMNQDHWDTYWRLFVTDDARVPNVVYEDGAVSVASCVRYPTSAGDRTDWFQIRTNGYYTWCQSSTPESGCTAGQLSYYDIIMHEVGHAIGLDGLAGICTCYEWEQLPGNEQVEQFPTMVGPSGCWCLSCGYIAPYVLMHTLSAADYAAALRLYPWDVVHANEPIMTARYVNGWLYMEIDPESGWCGEQLLIWAAPGAEDAPQRVAGVYNVAENGRVCRANVEWPVGWVPAVVWAGRAEWAECRGPYAVKLEAEGESIDAIAILPNPTPGMIAVALSGSVGDRASLEIYDVRGRRVRVLLDGHIGEEEMVIEWDGKCGSGGEAAAGTYIAVARINGRMRSATFSIVK